MDQGMDSESRSADVWQRYTWWLLASVFLFRLFYLAIFPLELCADEAYYWDWSRQLDWGYYSKPPMVAWLIALSTWCGGNSEFAIRLPAVICGTLGLYPVGRLATKLFDSRVGFWTTTLLVATPGVTALSILMTIDAPFLCAWAFAIWFVWELLAVEHPRWTHVGMAILATGFGLLSKQTMLAIFPLTAVWLVTQPSERWRLKSPKYWVWCLGSLACLTPVVWWNAQHDWLTVQHTGEHFQQRAVPWIQHLVWFCEFWLSQLGIASPITCVLAVMVMIAGMYSWRLTDRRVQYLLCLGALPMVGVSLLSFTQRVQPNWPAAFMLPSFLLVAAWGCQQLPGVCLPTIPSGRLLTAGITGGILVLALYASPFVIPNSSLAGTRFDPTVRLRGWESIGNSLESQLADGQDSRSPLVIATTGRSPVSLLAYYIPSQPRVYRWNPTRIVESQHEVWGGPRGNERGRDAVIVSPWQQSPPEELVSAFDTVVPAGSLENHLGGNRWERLQLWRGVSFRDWPNIQPRVEHLARAADSHNQRN